LHHHPDYLVVKFSRLNFIIRVTRRQGVGGVVGSRWSLGRVDGDGELWGYGY